ncbi:hypothetical protein KIN20_003493 [Parelaphostrongylus tenuis]|uniref:Uncharacterized protein n=1 Tax=Parelaphostrongylus tenuis TaxID=148309 RepID=A0AAD5QEF1_PARTN|nr:hypothetical protein KIN20_003493 [Parelaphostrongylus tenuis]
MATLHLTKSDDTTPTAYRRWSSKNSSYGRQSSPPTRPPPPPSLPKNPSLNRKHLRQTRIRVEVPFVATRSLINFIAPISRPVLEYPMEYHKEKYGHATDLALKINTEPSGMHLCLNLNNDLFD